MAETERGAQRQWEKEREKGRLEWKYEREAKRETKEKEQVKGMSKVREDEEEWFIHRVPRRTSYHRGTAKNHIQKGSNVFSSAG